MSEWIDVRDRLPATDSEEVEFRVRGKVLRGRYYPALPYPFEDDDPRGDAWATREVDGWRSIASLVAKVQELEAKNRSLQSRLNKWERWQPDDEDLRAMKEQHEGGPSHAASGIYIGHPEHHHRRLSGKVRELEGLLSEVLSDEILYWSCLRERIKEALE